jgi:hypothetical protein
VLERGIDGLIIDVDGTLLVDDRAVPGAAELPAWFRTTNCRR